MKIDVRYFGNIKKAQTESIWLFRYFYWVERTPVPLRPSYKRNHYEREEIGKAVSKKKSGGVIEESMI